MSDRRDVGTADTMRERADENRVKLWLLLGANRLVVAGVLTVALFVAFVLGVTLLSPQFARTVASGDVVETLFSTMITVIVTATTLVVSIGQLVLTQEIGPLGDQRERMSSTMDAREYTSELVGSPAPTDPADFLAELIAVVARRGEALQEEVGGADDEFRAEVDEFVDSLVGNADAVRDQLDDAQFGSFDVLFAALNFNYSWKIREVERIAGEYDERLTRRERDLLDELKTALSMFAPAREHVKTLYFQWALVDLSQLMLYAAVPTLAVAGVMVGIVDAGTFPGATLGVDNVVLAVGAAFAVTLVPFVLFVAYILRILTVAKRTLAIGPLILRDSQR